MVAGKGCPLGVFCFLEVVWPSGVFEVLDFGSSGVCYS